MNEEVKVIEIPEQKAVRFSDMTEEDLAIAAKSCARFRMVENDWADHKDMLMLAVFRKNGMPKRLLALVSLSEITAAFNRQNAEILKGMISELRNQLAPPEAEKRVVH
jgi:hypothetical protein